MLGFEISGQKIINARETWTAKGQTRVDLANLMNMPKYDRRHIKCPRFRPGLRETLLTFLVDIK